VVWVFVAVVEEPAGGSQARRAPKSRTQREQSQSVEYVV